jgi:hypothetical protein
MGCLGHVPAVTGPILCDLDGCPLPSTTVEGRRTLCGWSDSPGVTWPDEAAWQRMALKRALRELRLLVDALEPVAAGSKVFERARHTLVVLEEQVSDADEANSHKGDQT